VAMNLISNLWRRLDEARMVRVVVERSPDVCDTLCQRVIRYGGIVPDRLS